MGFFVLLICITYMCADFNSLAARDEALKIMDQVRQEIVCEDNENHPTLDLNFTMAQWIHYAQLAVRTANLYTKLWILHKGKPNVSEDFLFSTIRSNVEVDEIVYGSQLAFEHYAILGKKEYTPYVYRNGSVIHTRDLVLVKYNYMIKDWYQTLQQKNYTSTVKQRIIIETVDPNNKNKLHHEEKDEPLITYHDGYWSKPYYDCGGGYIWMLTFSAPILADFKFIGTASIDITLDRMDINQCDKYANESSKSSAMDLFRSSHQCHKTTKCIPKTGMGFRVGAYICECIDGYYPNNSYLYPFNGSEVEDEYKKEKQNNQNVNFTENSPFVCLRCAPKCDTCIDDTPCMFQIDNVLRACILGLIIIIAILIIVLFSLLTLFNRYKVVKTASPLFMNFMCLGLFIMCIQGIILFFEPSCKLCISANWLHNTGFFLSTGAILLKTWRITSIFEVKSAKTLRLPDKELSKLLLYIMGGALTYLIVWTASNKTKTELVETTQKKKFYICKLTWWDYSFMIARGLFLLWGVYLCIKVRKVPSSFNESTYISFAIYNYIFMSNFLIVIRLVIGENYGPDFIYILEMLNLQVEVTCTACLIILPKLYMIAIGRGDEKVNRIDNNASTSQTDNSISVYPMEITFKEVINSKIQNVGLCVPCKLKISSIKF